MPVVNPAPDTAPGTSRRHRVAPFGRCLGMVAALLASLFPMASPVAAATAVAATGGSAIPADTAAGGGTGAFTALAGPTIVEAGAGQVGAGTIVLTLPSGFEFDTASGSVGLSGASCAGLALGALAYTATTVTTTASGRSTGACTIGWSGLAVRPLAGTPRATGFLARGGTAAITGVSSGASLGSINEVAGVASQLAFGSSPTGGSGGIAFTTQPSVAVRDQFGNPVTSATPVVAIAISAGAGPAGATLACSGGRTKTAVAGVSTFAGCAIDLVGSAFTLTATAAGLAAAVSSPFAVTTGAPTQAVFTVPPGGGTGGLAWATQPVVRLLDAGGNPTAATTTVTLSIATGSGTAGAALACTGGLGRAAVAGTATFAGCTIDRAGTGYALKAAGAGLAGATSTPFAVTTGPAAKLLFATQPGGGTAGAAWAAQPVVAVADAGGNTVASAADDVTLSVGTNPGGGTLACAGGRTAAASGGTAVFAGCGLDRSGTGYTLVAAAPGLVAATSTGFAVAAAAAASLVVGVQPGGGTGGVAWGTQPVVRVLDAYGNLAASTATVTLAIAPGTGTPGAVLACTGGPAKAAVAGTAAFAGCRIDLAGTGYVLVATAPGLAGASTTGVGIAVGPPAALVFTTSPAGGTGGTAWAVQPVVEVRDAGGNPVTGSALAVTLAITTGTGTTGAVLACTPTAVTTAVSGTATFAGCRIDRAGAGYTLKATGSGVAAGTSAAFGIAVGAPARLAFGTQPGGGTAGAAWATQPAVVVQDAGGNLVPTAVNVVTIGQAAGPVGASLACAGGLTVPAGAGTALFSGCTLDKAGGTYQLAAVSPGLAGATSATLSIVAAAGATLAVTAQPSGGTGGVPWATQPSIRIVDQFGNLTTSTAIITLALTPGTGTAGATLACSGGPAKAASGGTALFAGCAVDRVGAGYTLTATSGALTTAVTNAFPVTTGPAAIATFETGPGGGTGGLAWATQPVVRLLDAGGNPTAATTTVTLSIATGSGTAGAALACTGGLGRAAVAGTATFAGCTIDRAGTGYALKAAGAGLAGATSTPFAVTTGPAAKLLFATQPGGGTAGAAWAAQPVVAVADAGGNTVASAADDVTLSVGTNPGGGTLACAGGRTAAASGGTAVFAGCGLDRSGTGYTLVAAAPGLVAATSTGFAVAAAAAASLVVGVQPGGGTGGVAWGTQPVVRVLDAYGNLAASTATVTLAIAPGTGTPGAVLACTGGPAKAAVAGTAAFAGCRIDLAGTGYVLVATAPGLAGASTTGVGIAVGPPAALVFTTSPAGGTGGTAWAVQPVVEVRDAGGNPVTGSALAVTLAITTGTGTTGAVLACTPTAVTTAVSGTATFAGCRIDRAGAGYTLKATGSGVAAGTSAAFGIAVGAPARLAFGTQPGAIVAGVPFATQPVVAVADAGGNTVVGASDLVSLSITAGTGTAGASLACTGGETRTAVSGVATFGGCTVDRVGTGYALTASVPGLASATAGAFAVTAAPASALVFVAQPSGGTGGTAWTTQPSLRIVDAFGNAAAGTTTVSLAVSPGTGGGMLTCTGGQAKATVSGVATFAGCKVDLAAIGYTVTATATGLAAGTSAAFSITPGPAVSMAFSSQPGGGTAAAVWAQQPEVSLLDAGGNVATGTAGSVTLALASGTAGAALACTGGLTGAVAAGVVSFTGCTLDKAGGGYALAASSAGMTTAVSGTFTVSAGLPVRLGFTAQPGGGTGGLPWATQPVVSLQDAGGNTVTTSGLVISLALSRNDAGGTFTCNGGTTRTSASGVATFSGCTIDRVGTAYELTATLAGGGAADAVSPPFNVVTGPAARLVFETQPGGGTGGTAWPVQPVVAVADAGGNATAGTQSVTLALEPGSGTTGATLACAPSLARAASAGRAAFGGCAVDRVGAGYLVRATATGLADGLSAGFAIVAGPAARLGFGVQPSGGTAGVAWSTQPVVTLLDLGGNQATGSTAAVTLDISMNPGGGTLTCSGGTTLTPSGGAAAFAGCSLDRAASGYVLRAAAGGLAPATSAVFGVVAGAPARLAFSIAPASGLGGSAFAVQPVVRVEDTWGNLASGSPVTVTVALAANPAGGTLACNGTTTRTSSAGLATFSGCTVDLVGTAYTIAATSPGLAGSSTPAFDVTPGPPARLVFALQPSGGTGGSAWASQPVIAVRDAGGNSTGATVPVTLALGSNPGSGLLTCATGLALVTVNGTVAFGGCAIDRASYGYTVLVTAPGLATATSVAFDVTVGAPTRLGFAVQPSGGAAGSTWSTQPIVAIQDAGGNRIAGASTTVSLAPGSGAAGALSCAGGTTAPAINGAAAFNGCAWTIIGSGHTIQAIASGLTPAMSQPFTVTVGTPARLRFATTPSGATGGSAFARQPVVQVTDAWDNPVTISSTAVALSLQANVAGGTLACNGGPVRATSAGLATFTGCAIDRAGSAYRLVATAPGLSSATSVPLDVVPGVPARIAFVVGPGNGMGGSALGTQPVVALLDAGGNQTTGAGPAVTLALTPGVGTPGALLLCTNGNAVAPSGGFASFAGCAVDRVGARYTLTASRTGFAPVVSSTFSVSTGPAAALSLTTGPGGGTGGAAWATQPVVSVVDAGGNPVASVAMVTLGLGGNPTGGVLACGGGVTIAARGGTATYAGCRIDRAGAGYALRATSPGLTAANGPSFAIVAGGAARTGFAAAPANGRADAPFAVQPAVRLYDAGGNVALAATPVTLTIATGTGTGGAVLSCPGGTTRAATNGLASFAGCRIDRSGAGFRLVASGPGLSASTSAPFDLTAPAAVLALTTSAPIITYRGDLVLKATFAKLGAARPVAFQASTDGSTWVSMATITANGDGVATYTLRPSINRWYRAQFLGESSLGPGSSAAAKVYVRQVVALAPVTGSTYKKVARGRTVTFTATVSPWVAGRPRATVTFTVWKRTSGGWRQVTSKSVRASLLARASYRYTFRSSGRWSVTAKAGATSVVLGSLSSARSLVRVR